MSEHAALTAADAALCAVEPARAPLGDLGPVVQGAIEGLSPTDWWFPGPREAAGATLRGIEPQRARRGSRPYKVGPPTASHRALLAVGAADGGGVSLVHLGVASAADGHLAEALSLAVLRGTRTIFLVAEHPLDGAAPLGPQRAGSLAAFAAAYGAASATVDGRDADAVATAVRKARESSGPTLIIARLAGSESP